MGYRPWGHSQTRLNTKVPNLSINIFFFLLLRGSFFFVFEGVLYLDEIKILNADSK